MTTTALMKLSSKLMGTALMDSRKEKMEESELKGRQDQAKHDAKVMTEWINNKNEKTKVIINLHSIKIHII